MVMTPNVCFWLKRFNTASAMAPPIWGSVPPPNSSIRMRLRSLQLFIMIFMFFVNVKLSLVVLSGLPIFAVIMMMIKKRQRKAWQDVSNKSSNLNAYLQENITGARVTQIFTREEENAQIFDRLSEKYRKSWINAVKYSNLVWPATDNVSTLVRAAIFVVGLLVLTPAAVSLGTIVAMTSYASSFWQPIMNLSNIFNNFINNINSLCKTFQNMRPFLRFIKVKSCSSCNNIPLEVNILL